MEPHYRCLIVDDEKPAHEVLKSHLVQTDGLLFAGSAFNGKEALQRLQEGKIDIVFLDIEMPLISGMELLKSLNPKPAIIVTTAFQEFAFEAWENDAVDYLKKPISYVKFLKAVHKAKVYCQLHEKKSVSQKAISLRVEGENIQIPVEEIAFLSSFGNYLRINFGSARKPLLVYERLGNLYQKLDSNFVQIHRSFVVNKSFISAIERDKVVLKTGDKLAVGRKYQVLLENKL
jgi:DNA-binding LytR/AlgR family response regulator